MNRDDVPNAASDGDRTADAALTDAALDELLQSVRWREPDAESVGRLQTLWDQQSAAGGDRPARTTPPPADRRDQRGLRGLRGLQVLATAVAIVLAWFAGRWSVMDQNAGSEVTRTDRGAATAESDDQPAFPADSGTASDSEASASSGMADAGPDEEGTDSLMAENPSSASGARTLVPEPIPDRKRRRALRSRAAALRDSVESVLACIEEQDDVDGSCVEPLLKWRRESEYLLWQVVQNATGQRRLAAVTAIGFVGTSDSVPGLVHSLEDEELRDGALTALQRCADEESLVPFIQQRQDRETAERFLQELIRRPPRKSQPVFLRLVMQPESRALCLAAADDLTAEAVELTVAALESSVVKERIAAAAILGSRTDPRTFARIVSLLRQHPNRWEPVAALMWNGSPPAMTILQQMQRNPESSAVLQTAVVQLQSFGPAE